MVGRTITSDKSVGQYFQRTTSNEITIAKISKNKKQNCVLNFGNSNHDILKNAI